MKWKLFWFLVLSFTLNLLLMSAGNHYAFAAENSLALNSVSGGGTHSVFLNSDGTVWTWGNNTHGQLGYGGIQNKYSKTQVKDLKDVKTVSAGFEHTVAIKNDGTVWAWGYNYSGQLGDSTDINRYSPIQVLGLNNIISIAAGGLHTLALKDDGTVWAWGDNTYGQLGDATYASRLKPVQVSTLSEVVAIAAGNNHSIALKSDGTIYTWGYNSYGQLGNNTSINSNIPQEVKGLNGIKHIAAGGHHSLALSNDGTLWSWGYNVNGQLGIGNNQNQLSPVQVSSLTNIQSIAAGGSHSLVLGSDGTVYGWGSNSNGQVGGSYGGNKLSPMIISNLSSVKEISAGGYHSMVLESDNTVWSWGWNSYGQIGDGTTSNKLTPVKVLENINHSPVLSPVGNQTVSEGATLQLTLKAYDVDGDILTYSAKNLPQGAVFDMFSKTLSWTPDYSQAGTYEGIHFEVTDGSKTVSEDISITVNNVNRPPVADAGQDQTITATSKDGADVTLDGTLSSDPDGDSLTYTWSGPFGTIGGSTSKVQLPIGNNIITLCVSDGDIETTDTVAVEVVDHNNPLIEISNVEQNKDYTDKVLPIITIIDMESGVKSQEILLDNQPYTLETVITTPGKHLLSVSAIDYAGNTAYQVIEFLIYSSSGLTLQPITCDYSDKAIFNASLFVNGAPISGKTITFTMDGTDMGIAVTNSDGIASLSKPIDLPAGNYSILAAFSQDEVDFLRANEFSSTLTVNKEKIDVAYEGQLLIQYPSVIDLSASVTQDNDNTPGDLSRITIHYDVATLNSDGTTTPVGSYFAPCDSLGKTSLIKPLIPGVYSVNVTIVDNDYFQTSTDTTVVTIYTLNNSFTTGGGWINVTDQNSGALGKAQFGFIVRYWNGQLTGKLELRSNNLNLKLKCKQINTLMLNPESAQFTGIGNIQGMRSDYSFSVTCIQNSNPWCPDTITIKVWAGTNTEAEPIYQAVNQNLWGGNVLIKSF